VEGKDDLLHAIRGAFPHFDRRNARHLPSAKSTSSAECASATDRTHMIWYLLATWFGTGYARIAPGTVATATVLPLYWLLRLCAMPLQWVVVLIVVGVSIWSADWVARDLDQKDPQIIVIDEVCGGLIALLLVNSGGLFEQLLALALFRLLDIFKPWPVNIRIPGPAGFDVVYDDVVAGIIAGLVVKLVFAWIH
jgi:phosphatidylglycerophosphatase A